MQFNFDNEDKPYSDEEAFEDLENIKQILHDAQRKINRGKLEKTNIGLSVNLDIGNADKT